MSDKKTILVVEDEKPLLKAIQTKLERNDFEVLTARKAEEAYDYLNDKNVDGVWLDHYLLGKEDGLDFVAKVKSDNNWKKIPVFVVSNTASSDKVRSYINFGVDKYYTKADYRLDNIIDDIKNSIEKVNE